MPTENLTEMVAFYTEVLDFKVTDSTDYEKDGEGVVFLSQDRDIEHHQLAFASAKKLPNKSPVAHFAFRTESLDDVKALISKLRGSDSTKSIRSVSHGNTWSIYFRDPDSNGIEVFCDTLGSQSTLYVRVVGRGRQHNDLCKTKAAIEHRSDFASNPNSRQ